MAKKIEKSIAQVTIDKPGDKGYAELKVAYNTPDEKRGTESSAEYDNAALRKVLKMLARATIRLKSAHDHHMSHWALVVAGLYVLILAAITAPLIWLAGLPKVGIQEAVKAYLHWQYWVWLAVMALSQVALLAVPVRLASRRPVTKGALWPTLFAGGFMAGALLTGAAYSILEFLTYGEVHPDWLWWGSAWIRGWDLGYMGPDL